MDKLKEIISEYAGIEKLKINEDMSLVTDMGLDSFSLISLVTEIEQTFEVSISDAELASFKTFSDVVNFLKEKSKIFKI